MPGSPNQPGKDAHMAPRGRETGRRVFVPRESFVADIDGVPVSFREGQTRVREGHEILDTYGHLFEEIRVQYEVEQATAAPGELR